MKLNSPLSRRKFVRTAGGILVNAAAIGISGKIGGILRAQSLRVSGTARVGSITRPGSAGGGGGNDPLDVSGCWLWVRASNDSGTNVSCYTDAGTTLANNGETIRQWNDESGNSRHLVQTASGERGTWNNNVVNSKAAITMVAASQQHWDVPSLAALTAGECFCVLIFDADPPAAQRTVIGDGGTSGVSTFLDTDGIIYDGWGSTARKTTANPTPSLTSWRLYNVSSESSNWTNRLDGTQLFNTGTNTVGFTSTPRLGRSLNVYFDGKFAEYIIYDHVLTSGDRTIVNDYIETKYGLTIA